MNLKRIFLVSRPIMWSWTILMFLLGVGKFSNFSVISAVEIFFFSFPLNFFGYGLNDIYDLKSDRINERKKDGQGIVPDDNEIQFLKKYIWIPPALFLAVASFSRNTEHILLSLALIFLAVAYSYKSIRLKEIPVLDSFTSALVYCLPGLIAYSLNASIFTLPHKIFLVVIPFAGIHAMSTLVDEEVDRKAGMKTIGVIFGKRWTSLFTLATFLISLYVFRNNLFFTSVFSLSILLTIIYLFSGKHDDKYFRSSLAIVLLVLFMLSLIYFILQQNII